MLSEKAYRYCFLNRITQVKEKLPLKRGCHPKAGELPILVMEGAPRRLMRTVGEPPKGAN